MGQFAECARHRGEHQPRFRRLAPVHIAARVCVQLDLNIAHALGAHLVDPAVLCDAEHPAIHPRAGLVPVEMTECALHRVLHEIVGICCVSRQRMGEPAQPRQQREHLGAGRIERGTHPFHHDNAVNGRFFRPDAKIMSILADYRGPSAVPIEPDRQGDRLHDMRTLAAYCVAVAAILAAVPAHAQLPGLGAPPLPVNPGQTVRDTLTTTTDTANRTVRGATRIDLLPGGPRDLVGRPDAPELLDADSSGRRVVRGEVLALSPGEESLGIARALGFEIVGEDELDPLGLAVVKLRAPGDTALVDALAALRAADPDGAYDFNHIYDPSGESPAGVMLASLGEIPDARGVRVGMVDAGIDTGHRAFARARIVARNFDGRAGIPTVHGTQIASLLVGRDGDFRGALWGGRL